MIDTGNKNFWIAQVSGWLLMGLSNFSVQYLAGYPKKMLILNSVVPMIVGFLLTTAYRYIIKDLGWKKWPLKKMIALIILSTIILTGVFMGLIAEILKWALEIKSLPLPSLLSNLLIFGMIMLLWNLIYFIIHYFKHWTQAEVDKWKLTAQMKEAQLGSLKNQINPHFVFNALNNIRSLILEDKDKARDMLVNFSDLFRYSLLHSESKTVPLDEEIEIVEQYLELLSIQYEDKLNYHINVKPPQESIQIPPMMLQLLVENAVKHGISQFQDGGSIWINIEENNGVLSINVENTGSIQGSNDLSEKLGIGIQNIRKRLQLIYNGKASLNLSEVGERVVAIIKIPSI